MALGLLVFVALAGVARALAGHRRWRAASRRIPSASGSPPPISRLTLPLVFATTLTALAGAILNARGRFLLAAFAPVAVNVVLVAVLLALQVSSIEDVQQGAILAVAVSPAGAVQLAHPAAGC